MKKFHPFVLIIILVFIFSSCEKTGQGFTAVGGQLPGFNIILKDSSFSPASLTVVAGSTINFLNQTNNPHTIVSDDTISLKAIVIAPGSYYIFKPAFSGAVPFHCENHLSARGMLIITP